MSEMHAGVLDVATIQEVTRGLIGALLEDKTPAEAEETYWMVRGWLADVRRLVDDDYAAVWTTFPYGREDA